MKLKSLIGQKRKNIINLSKLRARVLLKPIKKLERKFGRITQLEVQVALRLVHKLMKRQLKLRPRIGLIFKFVVFIVILYVATFHAVSYIKPKEANIKINGQTIVLSEADNASNGKNLTEIDQIIQPKITPFEFKKPVAEGILSQGFSTFHRANDIAAPYDSPIHPLGAGMVDFAGTMNDGHGNVVVIDHGNDLKTLYAHMDKINVAVGNKVDTNSTIGTIGLTGHTTGPHVHLEVFNNNVTIDPASVLPEN